MYHAIYTQILGANIFKHSQDLYITDEVSSTNHREDKAQVFTGMNINVNTISTAVNIPVCTSVEDIQVVTHEGAHLQKLKSYMIYGCPHKRAN